MGKNKTPISKEDSYQKIGEFWDEHDLSDFWDQTEPAAFDIDIQAQRIYYPIDSELSEKIAKAAKKRGITSETLINLWLHEKVKHGKQSA